MNNAVKIISPEVRQLVEERLTDGWPLTEIGKTLGLSYYMIRKHWPGRGWTHQQIIDHAIAGRQANRKAARARRVRS